MLTGVFYVDTQKPIFTDLLNLVDEPLGTLPESVTRPGREVLAKVMESLQLNRANNSAAKLSKVCGKAAQSEIS